MGEEDADMCNDLGQANGQEAETAIRLWAVDDDRCSSTNDPHARECDLPEMRLDELTLMWSKTCGR